MKLDKKQYESLTWLTKADSEFLRKHNLMDYSMLLVIESVKMDQPDEEMEIVESIGVSSLNSQENAFYKNSINPKCSQYSI